MLFFLYLAFLAIAFAHPVAAAERRCAGTNATVNADSAYDAYLACAGAADAVAFLSQQGFTVDTVMQIDILDSVFLHPEENPSFRILGQFDAKQNRIMVTSIEGQREMAKEKPIFGVLTTWRCSAAWSRTKSPTPSPRIISTSKSRRDWRTNTSPTSCNWRPCRRG